MKTRDGCGAPVMLMINQEWRYPVCVDCVLYRRLGIIRLRFPISYYNYVIIIIIIIIIIVIRLANNKLVVLLPGSTSNSSSKSSYAVPFIAPTCLRFITLLYEYISLKP